MPSSSIFANPETKPALDENLYPLDNDRNVLRVFQNLTGIEDEEELKRHALRLQKKAYDIYGYPCIRAFSFVRPKVLRIPAYREALAIPKTKEDAIFLDMGCCCEFGTDAHQAASDGWPAQNIVGSDLHKDFWECGHELFNTSQETFSVAFFGGDVFDPALIIPRPLFHRPVEVDASTRPTNLRSLNSLTPLQGHVSAIHASSFFHLFSEEKQLEVAQRIATLLSPEPGSIIFGSHMGAKVKGPQQVPEGVEKVPVPMFCHSPESWKSEVWDGPVFMPGAVEVKAELRSVEMPSLFLSSYSSACLRRLSPCSLFNLAISASRDTAAASASFPLLASASRFFLSTSAFLFFSSSAFRLFCSSSASLFFSFSSANTLVLSDGTLDGALVEADDAPAASPAMGLLVRPAPPAAGFTICSTWVCSGSSSSISNSPPSWDNSIWKPRLRT